MSDLENDNIKVDDTIEEAASAVNNVEETIEAVAEEAAPVVEPVVAPVEPAPVTPVTPVVPVTPVTPVEPVTPVAPAVEPVKQQVVPPVVPVAAPSQPTPVTMSPADIKKQQKAEQKAAKQAAKNDAKRQKKLDKIAKEQEKKDACPKEYKPVSVSKYFWFGLLSFLPIIGFLFTIITAFAPRNKNVKNFERAIFVYYIITIILALVGGLVAQIINPHAVANIVEAFEYFFEDIMSAF